MEITLSVQLVQLWIVFSGIMTAISTIFFSHWLWKHQEDIRSKKERVDQFTTLGIVALGGIGLAGMFGFAFLGLTYNAVTGNITGLEQIPVEAHIPIIIGIIGLCAYLAWAGLAITYNISKEFKKAIFDPTYKI